MRLYTVDEELRVRLERDVREWTTAGMLTAEQARALEPDLATDLRRTGPMLRSGLAMFTLVAGGAAIGYGVRARQERLASGEGDLLRLGRRAKPVRVLEAGSQPQAITQNPRPVGTERGWETE